MSGWAQVVTDPTLLPTQGCDLANTQFAIRGIDLATDGNGIAMSFYVAVN